MSQVIKIKICGLKDYALVDYCVTKKIDYVGFIFYKRSPRNISVEQALLIINKINDKYKNIDTKFVAVLVNPDEDLVDKLHLNFDYIQFHGNESVSELEYYKKKYDIKIIKAFSISCKDDLSSYGQYQNFVDYLLFDAQISGDNKLPGGNGVAFDWNLLKNRNIGSDWFLSGGLNQENVIDAINISGAKFIDVSSGVESLPGVKDKNLISNFIYIIRKFNNE